MESPAFPASDAPVLLPHPPHVGLMVGGEPARRSVRAVVPYPYPVQPEDILGAADAIGDLARVVRMLAPEPER